MTAVARTGACARVGDVDGSTRPATASTNAIGMILMMACETRDKRTLSSEGSLALAKGKNAVVPPPLHVTDVTFPTVRMACLALPCTATSWRGRGLIGHQPSRARHEQKASTDREYPRGEERKQGLVGWRCCTRGVVLSLAWCCVIKHRRPSPSPGFFASPTLSCAPPFCARWSPARPRQRGRLRSSHSIALGRFSRLAGLSA